PPKITLTNPANVASGVALNATVNATFSEAMDPLTLSTATFTVQPSGPPLGALVLGAVTYDALTQIATFTPTSNLTPSTTYTATITGAKDLAGDALVAGLVPNPWTFTTGTGLAPGAVALGSASTFGIMATSAITNTGAGTLINGDVSLDPGTSNGLLPVQVNGTIHINDTVSAQARADLLIAYNFAKALPPGVTISAGADLGALYPTGIPPGTYTSGSTMLVSTPLTLDAGGNANAVWVFQIGSSLTTGASISLANGAQAKNVFWVPTSDATVGVGTIFYGTIVAGRDTTANTGAVINGRILTGAITAGTIALDTNTVNVPAP
ncbi:MAG: ice-binding family protein, partial [Geothrix sp.]|nr:ice-binding family protein [Geothrix sp.]